MRCQRLQPHVLAFIEGELRPRKQRKVAAHLATCPACASEVRALQQTFHLVQATPVPEPSPLFWERFDTALRQRLQHEAAPPSLWHRLRLGERLRLPRPLVAAMIMSLILVSVLPFLRGHGDQRITPTLLLFGGGEEVSLAAELDFVQYLDLLEEVDALEQFDPSL